MLSNIVTGQCCGCDTGCDNYNDCPELPENELPESINFEFTGTASYLFPEIDTTINTPMCDGLNGLKEISIQRTATSNDNITVVDEIPRLVLDDGTRTKEYFKFFPPNQRQQFTISRSNSYQAVQGMGTGNDRILGRNGSFNITYEIVGIYVAPIKTVSQTSVGVFRGGFDEITRKIVTEEEQIPTEQGGPNQVKVFYDLNHDNSYKCASLGYCFQQDQNFLYESLPSANIHAYSFPYGIDMYNHPKKKLVSGEKHTLSIKSDGSLWAWGDNTFGQLGNNTTTSSPVAVQIGNSYEWSSVACGSFHSIGVKKDGSLWVWGKNNKGQLGLGDTQDRLEPTLVSINSVNMAAAGTEHTLVIHNGGEFGGGDVWSWGSNEYGQLGYTTSVPTQLVPKKIPQLTNLKSISCGLYHSAAIATIGTQKGVYCWGNNEYGQVGVNSTSMQFTTPQLVTYSIDGGSQGTIPDVDYFRSRVECGGYHTSLLSFGGAGAMEGRLWMWGRNLEGQLATDTPPNTDGERNELLPVQIELPLDTSMFESVGCGKFHTVLACRGLSDPPNTELYFYSVNYDNIQKLNMGNANSGTDHKFSYSESGQSALISCGDSFTHFIAENHLDTAIILHPLLWSYANNSNGHLSGQLGHNFGNNWHGSYDPTLPSAFLNTCAGRAIGFSTSGREILDPECPSCFADWAIFGWSNLSISWARENCNECKPVSSGGELDCIRTESGFDHYPVDYSGNAWFADVIIQPAKVPSFIEPPYYGPPPFSYFNSYTPKNMCSLVVELWDGWAESLGFVENYGWSDIQSTNFNLLEWQKTRHRFTSMRWIRNFNNALIAGKVSLDENTNCPRGVVGDDGPFLFANLPLLSLEDFKNPKRSNAAQRIQYLVSTKTDEWTKAVGGPPTIFTVPDSYHQFGPIAEEFIDAYYSLNPNLPIVSQLFISSPMKQNKLPETISLSGGNLGLPYGIYKPNIATKSETYIAPNCKKPCFGDEDCYDERWCCDTPPSCLNQACCVPYFEPGCPTNTTCEAAVCAVQPFCCGIVWDTVCATIALDTPACNCPKPVCGGATHDCRTCSSNPGCNDADCCAFVCGFEPACCTDSWSPCCVEIATFSCGSSGDGTGCDLTCDEWKNENPNWGQSDGGPTGNTGDDGTPAWCKPYERYKGYSDLNIFYLKHEMWPNDSDERFYSYDYSIQKIPDPGTYSFKLTWDPSLEISDDNITAWYDANDLNSIVRTNNLDVITLRNKSRYSGRDASASTEISRPVLKLNAQNGKNVISFNGRDHGLIIPSSGLISGTASARYTIFVVYKPLPLTDTSQTIFGNSPAGNLRITPSTAGAPNLGEANILAIHKTQIDPAGNVYSGGITLETWLNGERITFQPNTTNPYQTGFSSVWSLGQDTDGFNKLEFDFCELLVIRNSSNTSERNLIEGYLAHKWGLTDKLPANHPYKTTPPSDKILEKRAITTLEEQISINQTCHHPYYKNNCLYTRRPLHEIYSVFPLPPNGKLQFNLCNSGDGKYAYICRTPKINGEYVFPPFGQPLLNTPAINNQNCNLEGSMFEMPPFATTDLQIRISPVQQS
jgi:alpha-tubulin suppressor-like RCC1 family protein